MNVKFRMLFLSAIIMPLMAEDSKAGFFSAYAESVKNEFKPQSFDFFENGNRNAFSDSNKCKFIHRSMTAEDLSIYNKRGTLKWYAQGGERLKGGGMFSKSLCPEEQTGVDNQSDIYKKTLEMYAAKNSGKNYDENKPNAAAQGRRNGVAAGILLGPVNWVGFSIMCNTNAPQVGVGIIVLGNALAWYNLKAESTYVSDVCKAEYKNKKDFWAILIVASTIAARVITVK